MCTSLYIYGFDIIHQAYIVFTLSTRMVVFSPFMEQVWYSMIFLSQTHDRVDQDVHHTKLEVEYHIWANFISRLNRYY